MVQKASKVCLLSWLLVAFWGIMPPNALGWGPGGHRVVANIAYDQLDPVTQAEIVRILRKHPDFEKRFAGQMPDDFQSESKENQNRWIFLQASIWPDLVRPFPPYHKEQWHFINIPQYLTPHDQTVLQDVIKPNISFSMPNSLTDKDRDSLNCVQAFKLAMRVISDGHSPDEEKAISYCWLMHLAGDTHQPLHSTGLVSRGRFNTSEGDRGGNGIKIKQGKNLHSFWDGLLGGDQTMNSIRKRSADILADIELKDAAEKAVESLTPEQWVQESNELTKSFVYSKQIIDAVIAGEANGHVPLQKVDLPLKYRQDAGRMAQKRVGQAGYRLAEVLKQLQD
jgi:hypothetical protein